MGVFYGLLPFLYINALMSAEGATRLEDKFRHTGKFYPLYYLTGNRYPSGWFDVARRNVNSDIARKLALTVGKRVVPTPLDGPRSPPKGVFLDSKDGPKGTEAGIDFFQEQLSTGLLMRPILTSEELANQLRDDPRLAKAVVDAWIDTNNDGVITGTEILGRK